MRSKAGKIPFYSDVLGQEDIIRHLRTYIQSDSLPHALLFAGEDGGEALPLALAFCRHILCMEPTAEGACGHCPSCRQIGTLSHPDLYPIFPVVKVGEKESVSADVLDQFRDLLLGQERFTYNEWKDLQKSGNKQLSILVAEAEKLIRHTSLRSFQSKHQVIFIWMPELMRTETANKLLKLLEEPPVGVVFIAVSHQPHKLLPTILSRFQRVTVPPIPEEVIIQYLEQEVGIPSSETKELGHLAKGNLYRALSMHRQEHKSEEIEQALRLLEIPLSRDPRMYQKEIETISKLSRPRVLDLIVDVTHLLREVLASSLDNPDIVYTPSAYHARLRALGDHLSIDSIEELMQDLQAASLELRQNANVKIVFFDLFLHISFIYARHR